MNILTAEQINAETDHITSPEEQVEAMKSLFLAQDQSSLYPINGRFNATERAFDNVSALEECNGAIFGLEFAYSVEQALSDIVNNEE